MSNYKDIWTKAGGEGSKFWDKVDFNHPDYKLQEHIFRQTLLSYKNLIGYNMYKPIESVLELGIGSGRMSKIMLEIFPNTQIYNAVDINFFPIKINNIDVYNADVADETFFENINAFYSGRRWDFVLASEVFMHIKPEDIERVIKSVKNLLAPNGTILNIDWSVQAPQEHSTWCYIHDYDKLYRENGLECIFTADIHKQKLFCYGA